MTQQSSKRINNLISEGGANSNLFWKIRKKLLKIKEEDYDTISEEGITLIDSEESKMHIANYFEDLYQAREGEADQEKWTQEITSKVSSLDTHMPNKIQEITKDELHYAIKQIKRGKSVGPDDIPNESLIEANKDTRNAILQVFNHIYRTTNIPHQWKTGTIIRLYKGKGVKGKCSNERGITLSSNMGKLFERIINNRIQQEIKMTPQSRRRNKRKVHQ